jgi:DNA topoisomerase-1
VDDSGRRRAVGSADVNAYLRSIAGRDLTAKDFRTWAGTVRAAYALDRLEPPSSGRDARRKLAQAVKSVASRLGNTPAICRRSYIHPVVVDAYLDGTLPRALRHASASDGSSDRTAGLHPHEQAVLDMLTWGHGHGRGARGRGERGSAGAQRPRVPAGGPGADRGGEPVQP